MIKNVGDAIIKCLEQTNKLAYMFGSSGQANASMMISMRDSVKIKPIIVRNEQAASFMACGYAMFSDNLGVCFSTGGPGEFNLFSGLAVAYSDSLPVLAISGYPTVSERGKGALNESTGLNRTPDSPLMFGATTKKNFIIESPADVCDIMEEAINLSFAGRPGPVHIHLPKDVALMEVTNFRDIRLDIKPCLPKPQTIISFADKIKKTLGNNEKLVILIGYGCVRAHARDELLQLVEKYNIPFMFTMDAKGYLSEDHPLSLGTFGSYGDPMALDYFKSAQVVLACGNSFAGNATFAFNEDLFNDKTLMHINIDRNEINKVYNADFACVSDIKAAIAGILTCLNNPDARRRAMLAPTMEISHSQKRADEEIVYRGKKIHPAELVKTISKLLPKDAYITGDAGAHMLWLNAYLKLSKNNIYQNPGSFGPMASSTNASMGIKCAHPDSVVISASGDGCYLMAGFELLTAVKYHIPVIWIIFNNGEFNIIRKMSMAALNDYALLDVPHLDYVKYAEACGAKGFLVEKLDDFEAVFNKAVSLNEPVLIDVRIESDVFPPNCVW